MVFVSRTSIYVDANTRKGTWDGFASDSDAIGKGGDLVEVGRVLNKMDVTKTGRLACDALFKASGGYAPTFETRSTEAKVRRDKWRDGSVQEERGMARFSRSMVGYVDSG